MASGPELLRADDTGDGGSPSCPTAPHSDGPCPIAPHSDSPSPTAPPGALLSIAILCYINLLNYMDRFTVAAVLPDVEDFFSISDSSSGLLQTVFIGSYMVLAPLCGYWGDRRSRKRLLSLGLALWAAATMAGSFVPPQVTPVLGLVALALLVTLVTDPPRGGTETPPGTPLPHSAWGSDLRDLLTNRSLVLSTLGFTAVAFVSGALALWAPAFLSRCREATGRGEPCPRGQRCEGTESMLFGALTVASGVLGVGLGAELSRRWSPHCPRAEPLLCAMGLLGSAPCLLLAIMAARPSPTAAYIFIFLGESLLSLNWAIVAEILMHVVAPTRRSTAEALQIITSHLLGDAGSPVLVGGLSDWLRSSAGPAPSSLAAARALGLALLLCPFVAALGGGAFLGTASAFPRDRRRARLLARGLDPDDEDLEDPDDLVVPRGGRPTKVPVAHVLS
ncbi:protein spinster homolog 1 isoform X3 [Neopsephotus bourkii]|uniref:protein spinster homolog 1 isoform X3 n=1 Tax=Neopsephotus bourkii TaxID=309878 RepID=UPI002AA50B14|nr:protein spinster homolog 1 isoform X3 [Neopsephotus bourkii]